MKKIFALVISVFLILTTIISLTAIPASASSPLDYHQLALINFQNYYEYRTGGKKIKEFNCDYFEVENGERNPLYILIKFVSEDAEEKEYYNTFGEDDKYYEKSNVTNLMYPSGLVVCDACNMTTDYIFEYEWGSIPKNTFRDASKWTDDDFMSVEKACSLDPAIADVLVNMEENIGIVPEKEPPTTAPTEPTTIEPSTPDLQAEISHKKISLKAGKTKKLTVLNGTAKSWKSSDKKVATVKNGKITALKKGNAIITATLKNGKKLTAKVKVTSNPKLNKTKKKLKVKSKFTLKVNGRVGKTKFTSNKPKIATVTKKGVVKAKKKGTAKITVTTNGGVKLKCKITVG